MELINIDITLKFYPTSEFRGTLVLNNFKKTLKKNFSFLVEFYRMKNPLQREEVGCFPTLTNI